MLMYYCTNPDAHAMHSIVYSMTIFSYFKISAM